MMARIETRRVLTLLTLSLSFLFLPSSPSLTNNDSCSSPDPEGMSLQDVPANLRPLQLESRFPRNGSDSMILVPETSLSPRLLTAVSYHDPIATRSPRDGYCGFIRVGKGPVPAVNTRNCCPEPLI